MTVRVTPIGTCRITTPLRRGRSRSGLQLNLKRSYGFVHTSSEALQQAQFLLGNAKIPDTLRHLIMRSEQAEQSWADETHEMSDLYMVEISSAKRVHIENTIIQLNYATRHFADFFSDPERAKHFWLYARSERMKERRGWLEELESFQRLSEEDKAALAAIRSHNMSSQELESDMVALIDLLGLERLVFVTHVNATRLDNERIPSRNALITSVKKIANKLGAACYDPTGSMLDIGQVNALEKNGLDLTHYTADFSDRLFNEWEDLYFAPLSKDQTDTAPPDTQIPFANIYRLWDSDNIVETSKAIWQARREGHHDPELARLMGHLQSELGNFDSAIAELQTARAALGPNEDDDIVLMRCYFATQSHQDAWRISQSLISDETETSEILYIAAISAQSLGLISQAMLNWERLLHMGDHVNEAVNNMITLSQADKDTQLYYCKKGLKICQGHELSFITLWQHHLQTNLVDMPKDFLHHSLSISEDVLLKLADAAIDKGLIWHGTDLVVRRFEDAGTIGRALLNWRDKNHAVFTAQGQAATETGDIKAAVAKIAAALRLKPADSACVKLHRSVERDLVKLARSYLNEHNHEALFELTGMVIENHFQMRDAHFFYGRAASALDQKEDAYRALKTAAQFPDAPQRTRIFFARAAVTNGNYADAFSEYKALAKYEGESEDFNAEARRALTGLQTRAIRTVRDLIANQKYTEAWTILEEMQDLEGADERVAREKKSIVSSLYRQLRDISADDETAKHQIAHEILHFAPADPVGLKYAAQSSMRLFKFGEALEYWLKYKPMADNTDNIDAQIRKCRLLLSRQKAA